MHHRHFHHSEHDRGGPHHGGRRGGGGRHRAKRGAVAASILTLLAERPMNGYELITELETRSEGRWRPSPGAIYPALRKLEDRGSITSTVGGKLQFELTDRGRTMLAYYVEEQGDTAAPPWSQVPPSDRSGDMRALLFEMVGEARRVRRVGTARQIDQAKAIINAATVKLTALAAESPNPSTGDPEPDNPTTD